MSPKSSARASRTHLVGHRLVGLGAVGQGLGIGRGIGRTKDLGIGLGTVAEEIDPGIGETGIRGTLDLGGKAS